MRGSEELFAATGETTRTGDPGDAHPDEVAGLVDRCLLIGMAGTAPDAELRTWLAAGLGGVILFRANITGAEQLRELCRDLRESGTDVLIAADEEGGDITRLHAHDGSPTPGNLALGAVDDPELTRSIAYAIGTELRAANVNLNLAPTVDVNTNPDNPVIGTRSFGADPDVVVRHTVAYIEGLHDAGLAACTKHFPGHGDTSLDSHHDLPTVTGDITPHLRPFEAAIAAGVDAILTAHIVYPDLDERPATLSPRILTGLLREQLGFTGTIITDSLSMSAIAADVGMAEGAVRAMAAGADLLCMNAPPARAGQLPLDRLRDAAERVRRLAAPRAPATDGPPSRTWDADTARRALYVDAPGLPLPVAPYIVEVAPPRLGIEPSVASLLEIVRQRMPDADGVRLHRGGRITDTGLRTAVAAAGDRPLVLVVKDAQRDPTQRAIVEAARARRPDTLVVGTGTTADAHLAPGHYVGTRGTATINLRAAADVLLGPGASAE